LSDHASVKKRANRFQIRHFRHSKTILISLTPPESPA
jgi:hypothetical protein